MLVTRIYLSWENKKREDEPYDASHDEVYMTETKPDGTTEEVKVDKAFLDLTDTENSEFRYVL